MAKIFVSYRRDDNPAAAARVHDGLAAKFGKSDLFMDVEDLLAGLRFDQELAKALGACDVFIAIIGERWLELLKAKAAAGERDYVREEIAAALHRSIVVVPVRVGREGKLAPLPRPDELPSDIRDLVQYQKHDVTHEHHGRDVAALAEAIVAVRQIVQAAGCRPPGCGGARLSLGVAAWQAAPAARDYAAQGGAGPPATGDCEDGAARERGGGRKGSP
jgi:hypothetical protein